MSEEKTTNKLNDDKLDEVSGGLIFNASRIEGSNPKNPFEVIDDKTGQVLVRARNIEQAQHYARCLNQSDEYTEDWDRIKRLRENPGS